MVDERTEGAALSGTLEVRMGGAAITLRALTIDESDAWLDKVGEALATVGVPDGVSGTAGISQLLTGSSSAIAALVAAYDIDDALGGIEIIRGRMSKRELKAAMDAMVTAEDPFGEAAALSVATGFGLPSRFLAAGMRVVLDELVLSAPASSTDGHSASALTGPASADSGRASNSSSAGRTRKTAAIATKRSD